LIEIVVDGVVVNDAVDEVANGVVVVDEVVDVVVVNNVVDEVVDGIEVEIVDGVNAVDLSYFLYKFFRYNN
jgi:hypothetical protein